MTALPAVSLPSDSRRVRRALRAPSSGVLNAHESSLSNITVAAITRSQMERV